MDVFRMLNVWGLDTGDKCLNKLLIASLAWGESPARAMLVSEVFLRALTASQNTMSDQISVTASNVWVRVFSGRHTALWVSEPSVPSSHSEWECVTLDLYLCCLVPCVPSQPSDVICNRDLRWSSPPALTPSHITLIQTRLKEPGSWPKYIYFMLNKK